MLSGQTAEKLPPTSPKIGNPLLEAALIAFLNTNARDSAGDARPFAYVGKGQMIHNTNKKKSSPQMRLDSPLNDDANANADANFVI
jgi:hypothetical protein